MNTLDKRFHLTWGTSLFIAIHVAALLVFVVSVNWIGIALMVGLFIIRMFAITAGFHRYFAHHAFRTNRVFQFCLAFVGGTAAQKGVLWWVAHHRHHHQHSDTDHDLHSAKREGFYWSHVGWMISREYHATYNPHLVRDWVKYPELVWLDRNHILPPIILAAICFLAYGWMGLVWGFMLSTVLLYHAPFSVNSICHMFGTRRYATGESSRNTWWLAIFTLGESWHNNHHHLPGNARQGLLWWEVDLAYYVLKLLALFGIVRNLRITNASAVASTATL